MRLCERRRYSGFGWMGCTAWLLLVCAPCGAVPESRELSAKVAELLAQLDADQRSSRTAAERELLDLGPSILPLLPAPDLLPSVGVRATVVRIRVQLERRQALESVSPTRITLKDRKPLSQLLEAIAEQSGNPIAFSHLPPATLSQELAVDYEGAEFWSALDDLVTRGKLRFDLEKSVSCVWLEPRGDAEAESPVTHAGAFRISVSEARLRPVFGRTGERQLRVQLTLFAEPRLRPLFLKFAASAISVTAKDGKSLPSRSPGAKYDLPLAEGRQPLRWTLDFVAPHTDILSQASLSGVVHIELAAGQERIRFRNLNAAGVARRRGGVTVTLQRAKSKPGETRDTIEALLPVHVMYDTGGPAFESHRTWVFHNEAYLEDSDGRRFNPAGYDTNLQRDGIVGVTYRYSNLPGRLTDYEFVYVAPTLIVDLPLEFSVTAIRVGALEAEVEGR